MIDKKLRDIFWKMVIVVWIPLAKIMTSGKKNGG